ncbi:IS3 family transposase [Alteromonas sp. ASW11-130]|uniref:IS3 family transposase n=1 Tax=Alteromonas sp. ASW11-130 TaxID=3015775 RepID=UPI003FA48CA1
MGKAIKSISKRTQRDYTQAFKLAVVAQVEKGELTYKQAQAKYGIQGRSTVLVWLRKHGRQDWYRPRLTIMTHSNPTPEQRIKELERKLEDEKIRNLVLNEMIDYIDTTQGTQLRKKLVEMGLGNSRAKLKISLSQLCRVMGISRQSIYQAESRCQARAKALLPVLCMVADIRRFMPRLGTRKLYHLMKPKLEAAGVKLGRDSLFDYLRAHNLLVKKPRNYHKTTDSKHWMKKHPNLLKGLIVSRPEQVFVSDITYVETDVGIHYLSLVTDAYSRKIMGHDVSPSMTATDIGRALKQAIKRRMSLEPLIHHSDRGSQYCSQIYQDQLSSSLITPSMTDGYDCYQNALAERINGILKHEFLLTKCRTGEELKRAVRQSIAIYNEYRPHLSLKMKTPNEVHKKASCESQLA